MHPFVLQEFTTIRGGSASVPVTQGADAWLDMTPFQDVQLWVDIKELTLAGASPNLTIAFETAPTKDEVLFIAMVTPLTLTTGTTLGVQTPIQALLASATVPVARWLRWKLTPGGTMTAPWDITFRVVGAANSPGM